MKQISKMIALCIALLAYNPLYAQENNALKEGATQSISHNGGRFFASNQSSTPQKGETDRSIPFPKQIELRYSGPYGVPATMLFQHNGSRYSIKTRVNIPFKAIEFNAEGTINHGRFNPTLYEDRRSGSLYATAKFDYKGGEVSYGRSGQALKKSKITRPTKDFFSLAWEMALNDGILREGVVATNGKKLYQRNSFSKGSTRNIRVNGKSQEVTLYTNGSGDDRIELGFLKGDYLLPAIIAFYDKGKRYELLLTKINL